MLAHIRTRLAAEQHGFTLIELMVVILIIGILAAIAIPAFLNQRSKGYDSSAKSLARTAQVALETCSQDFSGRYDSCSRSRLQGIEPTLSDSRLTDPTVTTNTYLITVNSQSGKTVTIGRNGGTISRGGTVGSW